MALLRRAVLNGEVTLLELSQATGISKFTASRTAKSLVRAKLIKAVDHKASKKTKLFRPTQKGVTTLSRIEADLVEELLDLLDMNEGDERLNDFIRQLDAINCYLPGQGVGNPRFFVPPDRDVRKPRLTDRGRLPRAYVPIIGWEEEAPEHAEEE